MRPTIILLAILSVLAAASCRKRPQQVVELPRPIDSVLLPPYESAKYLMATPGNYWVYRTFKVNDNGTEEALNTFDTIRIEKDTLINKRLYHKIQQTSHGPYGQYITDSADYVVSDMGWVIFSASDFTSIFNETYQINRNMAPPPFDTIARVTTYMGDRDLNINVPVGSFLTSSRIERYDFRAPHDQIHKSRKYIYRYAKGVGLVSFTSAVFAQAPYVLEARLVQYRAK